MSSRPVSNGVRLALLALLLSALLPVSAAGAQAVEAPTEEPAAPAGQVNLNTASAEELQRLPGVGPSRAVAIVEYRERHPFRRLRPLLTLDGPTTLPPR